MTQQRRDQQSTEFGIWLRQQPEIDSRFGYVASNLDYIWSNYLTGKWMLIEEKRYRSKVRFYQNRLFGMLDYAIKSGVAQKYYGFHVISFEHTSPDDGRIFIDNREVSRNELISFLQFNSPQEWYQSNTGAVSSVHQMIRKAQ